MMKEIGSEFSLNPNFNPKKKGFPEWLNIGEDQQLYFSGRTAIDSVLKDIDTKIRSVYFPSYCCDSMIEPFLNKNIEINFYHVEYRNGQLTYDIKLNKKCDVFVAMNYFGFSSTNMGYYIKEFSKRDTIVIEDITHSLLSQKPYSKNSDYLIASLRKWFAIPSGGLAVKMIGEFKKQNLIEPADDIINKKIEAMQEKYKYLNKNYHNSKIIKKKNSFLKKFSYFNKQINIKYENLTIDELSLGIINSLNITSVIQSRKENVGYLIDSLGDIDYINLMIKDVDLEKDCPLFLPVIVKEGIRDSLRLKLIEQQIYLPIHWPIPKEVIAQQYISNIYSKELSLVCDQRYSVNDMQKIVELIGGYQ